MKLYLCLGILLALGNRAFSRNIELPNTGSTLLTSTVTPNTESTLTPTVTPNAENISTTTKTEPKCPENMMSSPWRQVATTLECYCEYPFLPLPVNDTCFELFRQGPCEPGEFLAQPSWVQGKLPLPRCAPNSCLEDGLIPYNGTCHNIITHPLCEDGNLYFREKTSDINCRLPIHPRTSINVPLRRQCKEGSRLDRNGRCRKML